MIKPKKVTEDLLLSITKICERLVKQIHTKPQETLEFKMIKPRKTFLFNPPISIEGSWMIVLTDLEIYKSIFNITEENNNFKLYKVPDEKAGGISYEKVRDEIQKDLDISDITASDFEGDIIAPIIFEEYKAQVTKRMEDGGYMIILSVYLRSVFQDFESYLRTEIELVEDDIRLVLDKKNSSFFTHELQPGIYGFKDLSKVLFNIVHPKHPASSNTFVIELDDITRKSNLVVGSGK